MLLEIVADGEIAELRRIAVPADGMAARPVAGRHGAGLQRHADAVAGVEAGAADLGELPARPEIARAHFGVGLEAAGGEHDALRVFTSMVLPSCLMRTPLTPSSSAMSDSARAP